MSVIGGQKKETRTQLEELLYELTGARQYRGSDDELKRDIDRIQDAEIRSPQKPIGGAMTCILSNE